MEVKKPDSVFLYCVVEESIFYYALLNDSHHILQSDGIQISPDHSFFEYPQVIIDFLKKSFDLSMISNTRIAIANTQYTLIPEVIPNDETKPWLTHNFTHSENYHIDQIPDLKIGYHVSTTLESVFTDSLPNPTIHHVMSCNLHKAGKRDGVYSYSLNGLQFIQLVDNQKTNYGNLKLSPTAMSALYFSLLPYELHQKDTATFPLFTRKSNPEVLDELHKYVNDIKLLQSTLTVGAESPLNTDQVYQIEKLATCAL